MMAGFMVTAGIYNRVLAYIDTVEMANVSRDALNRTWLEFGRVLADGHGKEALERLGGLALSDLSYGSDIKPYDDDMLWRMATCEC